MRLQGSGLAEVNVTTPITVAANSVSAIAFTARVTGEGPHPFTIEAETARYRRTCRSRRNLDRATQSFVALSLDPATVSVGPGGAAIVTTTLHNLGAQPVTLDLNVLPPTAGPTISPCTANDRSSHTRPGGLQTTSRWQLALQVPLTATAGAITYTINAVNPSDGAQFAAIGTVQVLTRGVQVSIVSGQPRSCRARAAHGRCR